MKIHLIDGTYELFRGFYGPPPKQAPDGREVGATVALLRSLLALLNEPDVSHIGVAFDHVVESFRNDLFPGYKTGEGIDPLLRGQFELAEQAVRALGMVVWPMIEFEADDAIATAAGRWRDDPAVEQIVVGSPDKDLAQLVMGSRVVCWDRRREIVYDERRPGIANLMTIYAAVTGESFDSLEARYRGKGYSQFKADLAEAVVDFLKPIQRRYRDIHDDRAGLARVLRRGAEAARGRAQAMLARVHEVLGFIPEESAEGSA